MSGPGVPGGGSPASRSARAIVRRNGGGVWRNGDRVPRHGAGPAFGLRRGLLREAGITDGSPRRSIRDPGPRTPGGPRTDAPFPGKPGGPEENRERIDRGSRIVHSLKGERRLPRLLVSSNPWRTPWKRCWKRRSDAIPISSLAIKQLLVARDHLAAWWMTWGTTSRGSDAILAQLRAARGPRRSGLSAWEIDLRQLDRECSGRIAGFFAASRHCGAVSTAPRIEMDLEDVTGELPRGPIHSVLDSRRRCRPKTSPRPGASADA